MGAAADGERRFNSTCSSSGSTSRCADNSTRYCGTRGSSNSGRPKIREHMMKDQVVMAMQMSEEQAAALTANLKGCMEQQRKE